MTCLTWVRPCSGEVTRRKDYDFLIAYFSGYAYGFPLYLDAGAKNKLHEEQGRPEEFCRPKSLPFLFVVEDAHCL